MQTFTDWLENDSIDCGIMSPPMEDKKALEFLTDYLLGENWYVVDPFKPEASQHEQGTRNSLEIFKAIQKRMEAV